MFSILSSRALTGQRRTAGATSSGGYMSLRARLIDGITVDNLYAGRSPYDYISNGGCFDSLGNKTVSHRTLDGSITISPKINGYQCPSGGVTTSRENYVYTRQTQPATSDGYAILNFGNIYGGSCYVSGSNCYVTYLEIGSAIVDGRGLTWQLTMTLRWNNGRFLAGQVTYSAPDYEKFNLVARNLSSQRSKWVEEALDVVSSLQAILSSYRQAADAALRTYLLTNRKAGWPSNSYRITRYEVADVKPSSIFSLVRRQVNLTSTQLATSAQRSSLARDAIEGLNSFDSNLLAYGSDLRKTGDSIKSVLQLTRNFRSPKAWASAWLSGRFGDRLTISDTRELLESLEKSLRRNRNYGQGRARAVTQIEYNVGSQIYSIEEELKYFLIAYNDSYDSLMTTVSNLMRWDAWPTLENTWDMVPLSFVVDWFLPVSDLLKQIDASVEAPYIKIKSQYMGRRITVSTTYSPTQELPVCGTVVARYYTRHPHGVLGEVKPFDFVADLPSFSIVNAGDALALLVQTSKKA